MLNAATTLLGFPAAQALRSGKSSQNTKHFELSFGPPDKRESDK